MSLPAREKQRFFLQLAALLRSGTALTMAAERLSRNSPGATRRLSLELHQKLQRGLTASEAFSSLQPALDAMERASLSAAARTGRLDATLQRLAEYYGLIHRVWASIIGHSLYPLFILHLGILMLGIPTLVGDGGLAGFLRDTVGTLAWLYAVVIALAIVLPILFSAGSRISLVDSLLRAVPYLGLIRRDLATARFFGTYDMQIDAGVNVIDGLISAGEASRSGRIVSAIHAALPELRQGNAIGPLLARARGALPPAAVDEFMIGEETGELHRTLPHLQTEYEQDAIRRMERAAEWLPRLLYLAVVAYIGWRIVHYYVGYLNNMERQIDAL